MLAKLVDSIPEGGGFLFEPKWDGFRAIVFRGTDDVYIQSRDLKPLDRYFPELHDALITQLPARCVVDGEIAVTQYDVQPATDGSFQIAPRGTVRAGIGEAGRLIPPTDHHVIANARTHAPSITLHVYGGDLCECQIFEPRADGRYTSRVRSLTFHD